MDMNRDVKQEILDNMCRSMASNLQGPLIKVEEDIVVTNLNIQQEIIKDTIKNAAYPGLNIKQEQVEIKDELPASCATNGSTGPLIKVEEDIVVTNFNVQQEIIDDTIENAAYCGLNIKQEQVDIKDELPATCAASGSILEEEFLCTVRAYDAEHKTNFLKYMLTHTKQFYSCSICGYKATYKGSLVKHMKIHTGEKPYECSVCEYRATYKSSLVQHMKKHTGEKPYKLQTGEKPYKLQAGEKPYKRHTEDKLYKRHTGEKPYECSYCEYKAPHKCNIVNHM